MATSLKHIYQKYKHLVTIQNVGLVVALALAVSWVFGAAATLQRNYAFQREVDLNNQQIELMKLQNQNAKYQQEYYKSDEFLELSARQRLSLASPGEKLVILPSSESIKDTTTAKSTNPEETKGSNFSRWMQLFFGNSNNGS